MDSKKLLGLVMLWCLAAPAVHAVDTLYDERFKQWTEHAESGDPDAQYNLGNAYLRGTEVARDYGAAASWFEKAADQDHAKALYKLGFMYLEGKGVKRDYGKAYRYLRKSAQQEYSPAQFYLGQLYAEGKGVGRDNSKALYWFSQAAQDNYVPAKAEVEKLKELVAAEEAEAKAKAEREAELAAKAAANKPKPRLKTEQPAEPKQVAKAAPEPQAKPKVEAKSETAIEKVSLQTQPSAPGDTKALLLTGNWLNEGGEPSKHMPSALTKCGVEGEFVVCETGRLKRTNVFARIDYMVKTKFGRFNENGEFMGTYRTNVLFVIPDDPDDPNPSEEDVPKTGWKQQTILKCKFVDANRLDCVNDNFKREHFSRSAPLKIEGQTLRAGAASQ